MKNYSKQREEIIGVIKELYNHPTAEEIYFLTKYKDSAVSRSTVYRNLNALVENGLVNQIAISGGPDRFDYVADKDEHGHILCVECGKLADFYYNFDIENLKSSVISQTEMQISKNGIMIKGICNSCKEAQS